MWLSPLAAQSPAASDAGRRCPASSDSAARDRHWLCVRQLTVENTIGDILERLIADVLQGYAHLDGKVRQIGDQQHKQASTGEGKMFVSAASVRCRGTA